MSRVVDAAYLGCLIGEGEARRSPILTYLLNAISP
jgi:hypothetical protein